MFKDIELGKEHFNEEGTKIYTKNALTGEIHLRCMSKPWDYSTAVYGGVINLSKKCK